MYLVVQLMYPHKNIDFALVVCWISRKALPYFLYKKVRRVEHGTESRFKVKRKLVELFLIWQLKVSIRNELAVHKIPHKTSCF